MHAIDIRPLTAAHLSSLMSVIDELGLFPSDMLDDMTAPFLTGTAPDDLWFVAMDGEVACAVAYCAPERMTDGTWNLFLIAVRENRQGQGVGARLTRHVERTLAERGARILLVETSGLPAFERARAVYRRLGFVEEARIREFYAEAEDKVVFWKKLTDVALP
ncbi:MAG: GNAT family N-acetyltransferase [Geminicoccaceae bacterium]